MMARVNRHRRAPRQPVGLPKPKWPKPRIRMRTWLFPLLTLAVTAVVIFGLKRALDHPVSELIVKGSFQHVTPIQVQAALAPGLQRGFLSTDLGRLRQRLERLDWVASARLRREWPDKLMVRITERRAAARWGSTGLLDVHGNLFARRSPHEFPALPELSGPEGSEHEVASLYLLLRNRLALGRLTVDRLSLNDRGAWSLTLKGGQKIRFGRRHVHDRVYRFIEVVKPVLSEQFSHVRYVDMRYTNGFAVGWRDGPPALSESTRLVAQRRGGDHG